LTGGERVSKIELMKRTGHFTLPDGTQLWLLDGKKHREDGPAVIYPDGSRMWCIDDNIEAYSHDGTEILKVMNSRFNKKR
jgi:hypothetical protein